MVEKKFDVFLCHNSQDKPKVEEIARQLQQQRLKPWLDVWELRPGLSWQELLEESIEQIKSAAVFVGSSGFGPWQKREMRAFLNEFVDRDCPVIPVLLESAPQKPQLPIFLKTMTWVDFRRSKPDPMEQLIWGITGEKPKRKPKPPEPQPNDVNYTKLHNLLVARQWKEADRETRSLMLRVAGLQQEDKLDIQSIENFPCTVLSTIDTLWVKYSNGHFGFSVQKRIWESSEVDRNFYNFIERVGWARIEPGEVIFNHIDMLTFNLAAPEGLLPMEVTYYHPDKQNIRQEMMGKIFECDL